VRGSDFFIAVACERIAALIVGKEKNDIWAGVRWFRAERRHRPQESPRKSAMEISTIHGPVGRFVKVNGV
jgi:hypothetical protein